MESNLNLRTLLNHLIQTCKDGQEGFLTGAQNVSDPQLRRRLSEYSLQRAKFSGELQTASHELGDTNPEYASSAAGTFHRGWMNLKGVVAGRDAHAILVECARGESCALSSYEQALALELPAPLREIVSRQHVSIHATHARIKELTGISEVRTA
jgi:uncharacterized protein (TIGR02284 family)